MPREERNLATGSLFGEYAARFLITVAKLIEAGADDFEAKGLTVQRTEKRVDLFLISREAKRMIWVAPQGYKNERLHYRMVTTMLLYSLQHECRGRMEAAAIVETESQWRAVESFFPSTVCRYLQAEVLSADVYLSFHQGG